MRYGFEVPLLPGFSQHLIFGPKYQEPTVLHSVFHTLKAIQAGFTLQRDTCYLFAIAKLHEAERKAPKVRIAMEHRSMETLFSSTQSLLKYRWAMESVLLQCTSIWEKG